MKVSACKSSLVATLWLLSSSTACNIANRSIPGPNGPQQPGTAATAVQISIPEGAASLGAAGYGTNPFVISPGISVTWTNTDTMPHTVTANDGSFDSGPIDPGQVFSKTFNAPGNFPYFCTIHGQAAMSGVIQVSGPPVAGQ